MVVNVLLSTAAEEQTQLLVLMPRWVCQQPVQHGTEGSDAGTGCDEDSFAHRGAKNEITKWPLARNLVALVHVAEKIRHEAVLHAIEAQGKVAICRWRRGDRVGPRNFLAIGFRVLERKPLSGYETKARDTL